MSGHGSTSGVATEYLYHRVAGSMPDRTGLLLRIVAVCVIFISAGYAAGKIRVVMRLGQIKGEVQHMAATEDYRRVEPVLSEIRRLSAMLPKNPDVAYMRAMAYNGAASLMPEPKEYYEQALDELYFIDTGWFGSSEQLFKYYMVLGSVTCELSMFRESAGAYLKAKALLDAMSGQVEGESHARFIISFNNDYAWFLSTVGDNKLRDPQLAEQLAVTVMNTDLPNPAMDSGRLSISFTSQVGAYVDTLAAAYFANGKTELAFRTQRRALALASGPGLYSYVKSYDKYKAAADASR